MQYGKLPPREDISTEDSGTSHWGVASDDLSGPHEATPVPGNKVGAAYAHYFLALSIKLPAEPPDDRANGENENMLVYVALLRKSSETPDKAMELLAQARNAHGALPHKVVYRLRSDRGLEFVNAVTAEYLNVHALQQTTTQGYDPSSNGAGEVAVGAVKLRARYLFWGARLPTRWWGMAVLAAGHLNRHEAGHAPAPKGTRIMANIQPATRNAFMPRSLPGTCFGPCSNIPGAYLIYQGGRILPKVDIQVSGMINEDITAVWATFRDAEPPIAPVPPLGPALYDAAVANVLDNLRGSRSGPMPAGAVYADGRRLRTTT